MLGRSASQQHRLLSRHFIHRAMSTSTSTAPSTANMIPLASPALEREPPAGFVLHHESTTSILFAVPAPSSGSGPTLEPVFLNPVQEYNRDLSIVAIRTWSEERARERTARWEHALKRNAEKDASISTGKGKGKQAKRVREEDGDSLQDTSVADAAEGEKRARNGETIKMDEDLEAPASLPDGPPPSAPSAPSVSPSPPRFDFTLLEALSATGLRAIRYAKEIPLLRYVIANDLVPSAVEHIRKNVDWNGLGAKSTAECAALRLTSKTREEKLALEMAELGKVRPNEGDACQVMYMHRAPTARFDCIDLDPYGSAVPFLDAAIGAVNDGGLLCVTCTDLGVLAGHNYPEKCFSHYGGVSVNAEYSHEVALRLVLHAIAVTAARYGRYIVPHLSLSIDFYVRVFVRVYTAPKEVKALASKTALLYYCHDCQSPFFQPLGRVSEKVSAKNGNVNLTYHNSTGPPPGANDKCKECGGRFHIGGPLWAGPLHDVPFVDKMVAHVQENWDNYGTSARIEGMLTVARSELTAPLYFTPGRLSGLFHCTAPSLNVMTSAIVNAGYEVSRSHASAGSIKTSAPRSILYNIMRRWIVDNPVTMKNVKENSPTYRLLKSNEATPSVDDPAPVVIDLKHNAAAVRAMSSADKVTRYQQNPAPNWGPAKAAVQGAGPPAKKMALLVVDTDTEDATSMP